MENVMVSLDEIKRIVGDVLQLGNQVDSYDASTQLLGSIPEFDSMAVVSVITAVEENFGIFIEDDEVSAEIFETIGSLHEFVSIKL
jgi:acyl carrier protein